MSADDHAHGHAHNHTHGHGHEHGHGHGHAEPAPSSPPAEAQRHRHGPNCGHLGIRIGESLAFCNDDDGSLEFYGAPQGVQLDDLCFEDHHHDSDQEPGTDDHNHGEDAACCGNHAPHMHAHLRSECARGGRAAQLSARQQRLTLQKLNMPPQLADDGTLDVMSAEMKHGLDRHECPHRCGQPGSSSNLTAIRHGDHTDYLVPLLDGSLEIHHPTVSPDGARTCTVHGALRPGRAGGGGGGGASNWRGWMNLFVFKPVTELLDLVSQGHHCGARSMRTTMYVEGICCPSEVPIIERLLKPLPGVTQVMVNVPNRTTTVDHDAQTTAGDLVLAL